ncbi:arylamine N-acetyltransferase family protein [Paraburkholderia sp.]|uniref:arylamine N-acetyltransferase family protein n=1 Tax=Paraburkholderia sp. TaxID=1926495 RepID=UPI003D6DB567
MHDTFDLDAYFARIGYAGPRTPTLDVLREIHRLHPCAIPFENLDPLTGRRVRLEPSAVADKLVTRRRGGYCFEQNALLALVLTQLGFRVTPLIARVMWDREPGTMGARTHMLLRIDLDDGPWMADVGFGVVTVTAPLRLIADVPQQTPHETFRLVHAPDDAFDLELLAGDTLNTSKKIYRFDLQRAEAADYQSGNWYTSTYPESLFVSQLVVCRVTPHARLTLFNDRFTERTLDGHGTERTLGSARELELCLRDAFGLDLTGIDVESIYARVSEVTAGV